MNASVPLLCFTLSLSAACTDRPTPTQAIPQRPQAPLFNYEEPTGPEGYKCPESIPLPPVWWWQYGAGVTGFEVFAVIKPEIARRFFIPTPYTKVGESVSDGKKFCAYTHSNKGTSTDNDWEVEGGQIILNSVTWQSGDFVLLGYVKPVRYDGTNARFTRISQEEEDEDCDGVYEDEEVVDPNEPPCDEGTGGGGGSGMDCSTQQIYIDMDTGDGTGWHQVWTGFVTVCE